MPSLTWSPIDSTGPPGIPRIFRTAVPGGWLLATPSEERRHRLQESDFPSAAMTLTKEKEPLFFMVGFSTSLVFVPDPDHTWDGNSIRPVRPLGPKVLTRKGSKVRSGP